MNPVYNNSVPFYPTIPNQNPINTFFPNQLQHNGQYSRDTYAPHFQNAGYSNPPPVNVTYPPNFGYNSHRFFPSTIQRSVYSNLGPMFTNSHHNPVNPGYYPNTHSGMPCGCTNHNPVNSNHVPPYPRLLHIGNFIYPLANPNHSTEFNHWPGNQNNTYYPPANNVAGNSTNANWPYHSNFNQSAFTQSAQNPPHNFQAGHQAANLNNTSWIPYSNQNTFQPIPDEDNDNLSEFSFDPLSSCSELNLLGSTPDLPATCNHNFAFPNAAHSLSVNSSQCTLEVCGNHTDINQNSENQTTDTNVSSLDHRICSDVQEELIPSASLAASNGANEVLVTCTNSDPVKSDSTTTAGQSTNTSPPVSTLNTTVVNNGTETVPESTGLNQVINSRMVNVDLQNIEASEKDQTLEDSISQAEKIANATEAKSTDASALETTVSSVRLEVENITTSSTSVNPPSPRSSPMNTSPKSKETAANLDHTYHNDCPTNMNSEEVQSLNNNTVEPNNNSQVKPQSFAASTAEPNDERFSPKCAGDEVNLPTQISTNFRRLLIRYLNRLDNVNTATDSPCGYLNIDDDVINSFVASLNSENRRLLQQDPNNIGTGSLPKVTENVGNENQENVSNIEKKEAKHNGELDLKENEENTEKIEQDQYGDTEPEIEQCNVLQESCADLEEPPAGKEEDSSESQQHFNEYQSADDVDIINMDLDTIEVTVGDVFNSSVEEEFSEDVPLDLAKEKEKIPEFEAESKSRYFEVSQFLPRGHMYWHQLDVASLEDNTSSANGAAERSLDVLVELPLNLTCKNRANTVESQAEDIASSHPSLLTPQPLETSLISDARATNSDAMNKKESSDLMKKMLFAKIITIPSGSEPPMKKIRIKSGESIIFVKTNKPKM
ncbi:hypothetical protein CBL_10203 [Carabus blaptoides fortunei]